MDQFLPLLVCVGALAVVMGFLGWVAVRARRRGLAGSALQAAMASYDEAFRVTSHASYYEIRAQADRQAPMAAPDDPWRSPYDLPRAPRARGRRGPGKTFRQWWRRG
ncbi:hypothetical protein AB0891_31180 [Streptomyces sp. NPDC007259]|uniref:hypothetical protein n=1 Tax=Streptomyces sp. NPDC007259 TaxID=3154319 RepID=UPI0034559799